MWVILGQDGTQRDKNGKIIRLLFAKALALFLTGIQPLIYLMTMVDALGGRSMRMVKLCIVLNLSCMKKNQKLS